MGAYTFSREPPFTLLEVSPYPIVHDTLYNGPWDHITQRRIDYCVFPTTFFIEGGTIFLSLGHQDRSGYVATLDLRAVLDSLLPVHTHDNPSSAHPHLRSAA